MDAHKVNVAREANWKVYVVMALLAGAKVDDLAAALATLVERRVGDLVEAWSPTGGNFIEELTNPGRSGAVYGSAQEGLNAVSDAMFYLEKETKDMKLAKPLGIMLSSWLVVRIAGTKLDGISFPMLFGTACLAGVGFTMSIFISELAFTSEALIYQAKIGVLIASLLAAATGAFVLHLVLPKKATAP